MPSIHWRKRPLAVALSCIAVFSVAIILLLRSTGTNIDPKRFAHDVFRKKPGPTAAQLPPEDGKRAKAALISLVRNSEIDQLKQSMTELEAVFNHKFNYPWIFFNDEPFDENFKKVTRELTNAEIQYEQIPKEHWEVPSWINKDLMYASFDKLASENVQYSKMLSYHQMCRWNSGMFYKHPALDDYKWYWRVEPNVHFYCDIDYDVFRFMEKNNKTYGFTINLYDSPQSLPTLWPTTEEYIDAHPEYLAPDNSMEWLTDATNRPHHNFLAHGYSACHFWSNFEIADLDFWRGDAYDKYFEYLDKSGGFFYERWGDAPVHSIGVGLFADKSQVHYFDDIGYNHVPFVNCPDLPGKCRGCEPNEFFRGVGLEKENCMPVWNKMMEKAN
ncbi:hypothetical protein G7K_6389-t1 [Saitoella complicata NRRL Y-17804]|uniref:Glycosyltransferase family 15 protein n=1 Tax=Saitoella complicata (strain BCRC 22490 / CBS 7301 / JCM 7358 / NBRC 10748 / NRRL Y-17804) TaxID=698492 RepID=A0A0E9NS91_SAICN|nr:hypothetical protein G7K_6389-t1 [Saitoella complicata NRRL Y-17804]